MVLFVAAITPMISQLPSVHLSASQPHSLTDIVTVTVTVSLLYSSTHAITHSTTNLTFCWVMLQGVFVYWVTSSSLALAQRFALRRPGFQKLLRVPVRGK